MRSLANYGSGNRVPYQLEKRSSMRRDAKIALAGAEASSGRAGQTKKKKKSAKQVKKAVKKVGASRKKSSAPFRADGTTAALLR
jgi:hypothetical protein